ncbi:MAG TPA: transposase [Rhizomicrobium sp.]|nr:transposase [Rhizomicrobium sp.]
MQAITFRLADSLPRTIYDRLVAEAADESDRRQRLDSIIDEGRGACILRDHAALVQAALQYFDGERYRLLAWAIMPNHVHVLVEQLDGFPLAGVVQGWKSFSAREINNRRGAKGAVWAPDYYDRYIRNGLHLTNAIAYIENNPVKAGLVSRAEDWLFSSATNNDAGGDARGPRKKHGKDSR